MNAILEWFLEHRWAGIVAAGVIGALAFNGLINPARWLNEHHKKRRKNPEDSIE